jgi:hypothetical protein
VWVVVVLLLITVSIGLALGLARGRKSPVMPLVWDIPRTAGTYTTITAALAGANIVGSTFIANLTAARESAEFADLLGMFIMAFFLLIGTAMEYATTPNRTDLADDDYTRVQRYSYFLASQTYVSGMAVSWSGLRLLALAVDLSYVGEVLYWVLAASVLSGMMRQAQNLYRLTENPTFACLAMPAIAVALAVFYRIGLSAWFDGLRPAHDELLMYALVIFAIGAVGFSAQSTISSMYGREEHMQHLRRYGDLFLFVYSQAVFTAIAILLVMVA